MRKGVNVQRCKNLLDGKKDNKKFNKSQNQQLPDNGPNCIFHNIMHIPGIS